MTFGLGTLALFVALSSLGPEGSAKVDAKGSNADAATSTVKDRLPSKVELKEAMGMAAEIIEKQRQKLMEERRRLQELKAEIAGEIERLGRLQKRMKSGDTPPMPTIGTSMEDMKNRAREKLSKEQAAARKARVRHVAKSLAAMSPKAAAVAISRMDDRLAVELLSVVDGKKVGKIFEAMNAERAAVLMQKVIDTKTMASPRSKKKGSS